MNKEGDMVCVCPSPREPVVWNYPQCSILTNVCRFCELVIVPELKESPEG